MLYRTRFAAALAAPAAVLAGLCLSAGGWDNAASYQPRITDLMGSVGWPGDAKGVKTWKEMGLTWGRDDVHPGRVSPAAPMDVSRTGPGDSDLPSILLTNNRNDIRSVLLLAYSAPWNTATGDALSAPKDVKVWEEYVEAAVTKYAAAPYNIRYFQIWNEAAGRIISAPQSTFWHGPGYPSQEYARAMEDYVDLVHIPAARIIRQHRCMVVYGGWPDQGGIEQYEKWLDYHDLARWSDYLDIHYLGVAEMDRLYRRYVATGICRGVWQTEIGDTYCKDPRYLSRFYFSLARWALEHGWDQPDKFAAMVYHWSGPEDFRLTQWNNPAIYTPSGRSLITLRTVLDGPLATYRPEPALTHGGTAAAIRSGDRIVVQVEVKEPGRCSLTIPDPALARRRARLVDAITGIPGPEVSVLPKDGAALVEFNAADRTGMFVYLILE
jgi:hypothetical protein